MDNIFFTIDNFKKLLEKLFNKFASKEIIVKDKLIFNSKNLLSKSGEKNILNLDGIDVTNYKDFNDAVVRLDNAELQLNSIATEDMDLSFMDD